MPGHRDLRLEQLRRHQTEIRFQLPIRVVQHAVAPGDGQLLRYVPRALVAVPVHFAQRIAQGEIFPHAVEPDLLQVEQAEVVVAGRTGDFKRGFFNFLGVGQHPALEPDLVLDGAQIFLLTPFVGFIPQLRRKCCGRQVAVDILQSDKYTVIQSTSAVASCFEHLSRSN